MSVLLYGSPDWTPPDGEDVLRIDSVRALARLPGVDPIVAAQADLADVLRCSGDRPVVVVGDTACEAAWLRAGATEVVPPGADPQDARCVLDRARARHDASAHARAFENRYRALLGALPDVIARLRDDGLALDFYVPDEFETDFPPETLLGQQIGDVVPDEFADLFAGAVARLRESGEPQSYRYTVDVDGEARVREARVVANGEGEVLSILRDVTDLARSTNELEASRAELRALAARLQAVREEERARLARDVHDVIGQGLTAIRLTAGTLARRRPDDAEVQARVADLRDLVDETIGHARRVATDLRPGSLDDLGLVAALEWQARRFEEQSGLTCIVETEGPAAVFAPGALPEPLGTAVFRIVQEALTNVARHADASEIAIRLVADGAALRLGIRDDGRGLPSSPPDTERRPLGLVSMRERALAAGGRLSVDDAPGGGALVRAAFPDALRPAQT